MKKALVLSVAAIGAACLALSIGCSKKSSDPAEAMVQHTKELMKIVKDNLSDCDKALKEVTSYTSSHKTEIEGLSKAAEEMAAKMSEEEKKSYGEKMTKNMESMLQESMAVMMEFSQKCSSQSAKMNEVMGSMMK